MLKSFRGMTQRHFPYKFLRKMLKESRRKIKEKEEIKDKRNINLYDSGGNG